VNCAFGNPTAVQKTQHFLLAQRQALCEMRCITTQRHYAKRKAVDCRLPFRWLRILDLMTHAPERIQVNEDRELNKTRNLILARAALPQVPQLKIWF
jgi:hypothetical protein